VIPQEEKNLRPIIGKPEGGVWSSLAEGKEMLLKRAVTPKGGKKKENRAGRKKDPNSVKILNDSERTSGGRRDGKRWCRVEGSGVRTNP